MLFFEPREENSERCTVRFAAKDGESVLGCCNLLLHDALADIVLIQLRTDDLSIAEGLLRSAFHYAANRGYYIGCFSAPDCDSIRAILPFERVNGVWQGDIPSLLAGACGKN